MKLFYRFLLGWTRLDLIIARSAPTLNMRNIEQLCRDESEYDRQLIRLENGL